MDEDSGARRERVRSAAEPAYAELVQEYGPLPLIGMGHSAGALMHVAGDGAGVRFAECRLP